ncbi:hypothetical protein J2T15_003953 [Paenibacillus harenae]|uniref:DUF4044 domain-containing protein n=1 Tax=Paenibacillus harenae TaxID=306543 RepID=A0ABT9U4D5_PAEHA|nr:hypothetical protein [Paenibacillus harenae]MDQ0114497.1 hypothetical protein [Paenibacillus harenae]
MDRMKTFGKAVAFLFIVALSGAVLYFTISAG